MASPVSDPEAYKPVDSYEWMISCVREKFIDALVAQQQNPGFNYVGVPFRHPLIEDPLALFSLVDNTEDMTTKMRDMFFLGVPIARPNFEVPQIVLGDSPDHDSFLLVHVRGGRQQELIISRASYDEQFADDTTPLSDFESKVMQYIPFPNTQKQEY